MIEALAFVILAILILIPGVNILVTIAAFVFLGPVWGIVALVLSGIVLSFYE